MAEYEFEWDDANTGHLARHKIVPQEIAEVFARDPFFSDDEPVAGEERFLAYGVTANGRLLTISFTERKRKIRPITGWEMTRQELKHYAKEILDPAPE